MDGGDTHNFIDAALVERRNFQAENFDGSTFIIPGNNSMDYTKWIPKLQVTLVNHTINDNFYVLYVADTNVVFGVQWLYYVGEHTVNYRVPEIRFKNSEGKPILLRGMHTYLNQVVSSHGMRTILRHGDIEWVVECLITSPKPHLDISKHPKEIEKLLSKYEKVFVYLPPRRPPNRGVEHIIELEIGTQPIKMHPYRHLERI